MNKNQRAKHRISYNRLLSNKCEERNHIVSLCKFLTSVFVGDSFVMFGQKFCFEANVATVDMTSNLLIRKKVGLLTDCGDASEPFRNI